MGNSASSQRKLGKELPKVAKKVVKAKVKHELHKKVAVDYLKIKKDKIKREIASEVEQDAIKNKTKPKIYTERPKEDEDLDAQADGIDKDFFRKAVDMGIVQVREDTKTPGHFDKDHSSLRLVKNRESVEKEYETLLGKEGEKVEYDIPERFLTKEQREKMKQPRRRGNNTFGLIDSKDLTELIAAFKKGGIDPLDKAIVAKGANKKNEDTVRDAIASGLLSEPSFQLTVVRKTNAEGQVVKEKMVVVPVEWEAERLQAEKEGRRAKTVDEIKKSKKQPQQQQSQTQQQQPKVQASHPQQPKRRYIEEDGLGEDEKQEEESPDEILSQFKQLEDLIKNDPEAEEEKLRAARKRSRERIEKKNGGEVKRYL